MSWILGQHHTKTVMIIMFCLCPENIWQQLPSNVSNLYCFKTVLHQSILQGRGTTDKSKVPFHCPTALHPLLGEESSGLINDEFSLLLTDSKRNPTLLRHQDWVLCLLFPSLQHQRQILQELYKRKLINTTQFSHRCGVTGRPMFY
jgi:hypothetical protein